MRRIHFSLVIAIMLSSCSNKIQLKNSNGSVCTFEFPKGARITKIITDEPFLNWLISFPNNKKIFISNDDISGCPLNTYKQKEYGENVVVKIVANDTLTLRGENEFGYWKEVKKNGIVYGYMNIPNNEIIKYEMLILPNCHK